MLGFLLGISKEVAAQYGIVNCHYLFKGKVESGLCQEGIEGMKVSILVPTDTLFKPVQAFTDASGDFQLTLDIPHMPRSMPALLLRVEDVDGDAGKGKFLSQEMPIKIDNTNVFETHHGDWDNEYRVLYDPKLLMRKEDGLPCFEKKQ